jgi:hypothetical protein
LRNAEGIGRYRRSEKIPVNWAGKSLDLILEGVFQVSVITVDETAVAVQANWRSRIIAGRTCSFAVTAGPLPAQR